jgi:hypothetical protein
VCAVLVKGGGYFNGGHFPLSPLLFLFSLPSPPPSPLVLCFSASSRTFPFGHSLQDLSLPKLPRASLLRWLLHSDVLSLVSATHTHTHTYQNNKQLNIYIEALCSLSILCFAPPLVFPLTLLFPVSLLSIAHPTSFFIIVCLSLFLSLRTPRGSLSVMEKAFTSFCEEVVPDFVADALNAFAARTGLRWGVMSSSEYWFQPPKVHVVLFAIAIGFCAVLHRYSRGFRSHALTQLAMKGLGSSVKCPINTLIACILMVCLVAQVYTKGTRPKPLVQLAWLLMPCHVFTAVWIFIFLHNKPRDYPRNCYLASLMVDWLWAPVGAVMQPDMGDHRFPWEGHIFVVHHGLLLLLPFYYAARYDTLGLSWPHVFHFTWVPTFVNFAFFGPYALFIGLNVNYQLAPPPLGSKAPAVLRGVLFRPFFVLTFVALSLLSNTMTRMGGQALRRVFAMAQRAKRKVS